MHWYLLLDDARPAPYNMAKDELCLRRAANGGNVFVRIYTWERPTLSIGRNQAVAREINLRGCLAEGVEVVRRMTGGKAVLHGEDLTYSVAGPRDQPPFQGGIMAVYRSLAEVLCRFFSGLGLGPTIQPYSGRERAELASSVCFSTPSAHEILVGGKKLAGSAQRLLPEGFLQHGSIPLTPQYDRLERIFPGASADELRRRMTDLGTLGIWERFSRKEVRDRLISAFQEEFGIALDPAPWSAAHEREVLRLAGNYPYLELMEKPERAVSG